MEELRFKYSGLFQNVDIKIYSSSEKSGQQVLTAEADIKLPVLKKSYITKTEVVENRWTAQTPLHEKGSKGWRVERKEHHGDAFDPISFFIYLNTETWNHPTVKLALGDKVIELDVHHNSDGITIQRRDKEQKLIIKKNEQGIRSLEIPIPILGNIVIKRV